MAGKAARLLLITADKGDARRPFKVAIAALHPGHHRIKASGGELKAPAWQERMDGCRICHCTGVNLMCSLRRARLDAVPQAVRSGKPHPWMAGGMGLGWIRPRTVAEGEDLRSTGENRGVVAAAYPIQCDGMHGRERAPLLLSASMVGQKPAAWQSQP